MAERPIALPPTNQGAREMSNSSLEYCQHATRCADLAHSAHTPEVKAMLNEISQNWLRLSSQIEATQLLLDEWLPEHERID